MKRVLALVSCLGLGIFLFTACTGSQAYQQYMQAYQQLWKVDSFVVERSEYLVTSENSSGMSNITKAATKGTYRFVRSKEGDMLIANIAVNIMDDAPTMLNLYFRDCYVYSQNITRPEENFRSQREADFAMNSAIEGIRNIPIDVINKQSVQNTSEGKLLTFELDSEKYYAHRFPETYDEYSYGEVSYFREQPIYTVLLDTQGQIKQVTGNFCTVNSDDSGFTWDQRYTIIFTQYGDVALDFPELNESDYPILENGMTTE